MSIKLFVSHSTKDIALVEHFIEFLESAMRVSADEIYCTSLNGTIPTGVNFVEHMKQHITSAELVLFLITENYFKSPFCIAEMGAAWGLNQNIYPVVVEPLKYDVLGSTPLAGIQAIKLNSDSDITKMYQEFVDKGISSSMQLVRFNKKLPNFIEQLNDVIVKPENNYISIEEYNKINSELNEIIDENSKYEDKIKGLNQYISELENVKDKQEVLNLKVGKNSHWVNFENYVDNVRKFIKPLDNIVISAIYNSLFSKYDFFPSVDQADWSLIREDEANGLLIIDDERILPDEEDPKIRKAIKSINELKYYLESEAPSEFYEEFEEKYEIRLDLSRKNFWDKMFYTNLII
jgi:chaperonin cofactor prefoldin